MDRLPNYNNFQQLWDFYTGKGGMSPTQAAGMLGNIYAESRANPTAVNPNDAGPGMDSFGVIQWNRGRRNALETFAQQRGKTADDLLLQAEFTLMEGKGAERSGFMRGMQAETPEEAAIGFAEGYIRPAAQHIPQRAEYGRMMYDIFANGNPNGVQPGLAFNPEQAARMSREREAIDSGEQPELTFGDRFSGSNAEGIVQELLALANPEASFEDVQPPMAGPRTGLVEDEPPVVPGAETSPNLGGVPTAPTVPTADQIDEAFPAPEGEPKTSEVIEGTLAPIAEASAYRLGVPVEDAPTTVEEVTRAATEPAPDEDDDSEEAEKKRIRRLVAADMLEVLSVGLGQMAVGQAVNVGPQLADQRARYAEQQAQEQAMQEQMAQAQTVAQELASMGMPGMARVAMSGPEGLAQALDTLGQVKGRAPTSMSAIERMTPEQRYEALRAAGADNQSAAIAAQFPDIAADMISTLVMPDPDAEAAAQAQAGVERELGALAQIGADYIDNPAVRAAATSAFSNTTPENVTNFRNALAEAGADLAAAEAEAGQQTPLSEGEAMFYRGVATPEQIKLAKQDPRLAEVIRNAGTEGMEAGAEAAAQQAVETQVPPERIRFLEQLAENETALRTELLLRSAEAGKTLNPTQEAILKTTLDGMKVTQDGLRTRAPLVSAMGDLIEQLSKPEVDRTAGGPLDRALSIVQNVGSQLGVDIGAQEDINNYMVRLTDSLQGEFFQNFRLAGSGATSDKEAENFMNAMPRVGDSVIKQLGLAQRIVRQYQMQERAAQLEQEYMLENADDPNKQLDMAARAEYVQQGIEEMGMNVFPEVNLASENGREQLLKDLNSGNITPETVVRFVNKNGEAEYLMYQDIIDARAAQ